MYTSCGWFFEELSRPEERKFSATPPPWNWLGMLQVCSWKRLSQTPCQAPSNVEFFKHGSEIYWQLVLTAQINFRRSSSAVRDHFAVWKSLQKLKQNIEVEFLPVVILIRNMSIATPPSWTTSSNGWGS